MDEATHIIDPDGEVMIILQNPGSPFAPWNDGKIEAETLKPQISSDNDNDNAAEQNSESDKPTKECFRILVSAKHLILSSPVFKKTLTGGWKEGSLLASKGSVEIVIGNWDLEAFLILMNIIHCQPQNLPQQVTLELLAKLAVVADYYGCQAVLKYFTKPWIDSLVKSFPTTYSRDLMLWLWISWFLKLPEVVESKSIAITQSQDVITNLGLPIPNNLIDELNRCRENKISHIISLLHQKRDSSLTEDRECSFECNSIMLGALEKNLHLNGLLSPEPVAPFPGLCYNGLISAMDSFKYPKCSSLDHGPYCRERYASSFSDLSKGWTDNAPRPRLYNLIDLILLS